MSLEETRSSFRSAFGRWGLASVHGHEQHFHPLQKPGDRGSWGSALGKLPSRGVCTYHMEAIVNFHKEEALDLKPQLVGTWYPI